MDLTLILKAVILGLVEGATEFIPVSSTGHLILVGNWLGFTDERAKTFDIFIQLGAILAVVWLYRDRLTRVALNWHRDPTARQLLINLIVAFLPAAVVGFFAHDWIKAYLFNPDTVAIALVLGGIAILLIERWNPTSRIRYVDTMPTRVALGIGLAQVLALFPGVSRSGATIMGALVLGLSRTAAAEFSFFLAIPVMFAASAFDLFESREVLALGDVPLFAVGFLVSFLSALLVVKAFITFISRGDFTPFAWYRIGFGILLLGYWSLAG
jgi:undecaprenyl-diphosphatase